MPPHKPRKRPAPEYLVTTKAKAAACPSCGAAVMTGLIWGERRYIDPVPLSLRGEAAALVLGQKTYELSWLGRPTERQVYHIQAGLPAHWKIHARHRCGVCWDHPQYRDERRPHYDRDRPCPF